jgi:hypothetical protein
MGWFLPPTDNIYKFCAVFGLMLMLGPLAGLVWLMNYTSELINTATLASAKTEIEWRFSGEHELEGLHQLRMKVLEAQFELANPEDIPAFFSLENIEKRIEARREKIRAISLDMAEAQVNYERAKRFAQNCKWAFYLFCVFTLIGGQLALFGFKNWYGKTQILENVKIN